MTATTPCIDARCKADADLLDDIRRAGCWDTLNVCRWCARPVYRPHKPMCLWLRIEARGERPRAVLQCSAVWVEGLRCDLPEGHTGAHETDFT